MQEWLWLVLAVLLVALVAVLALVALPLRRRWLARDGGLFECSVRLNTRTPGAGWVLGMARYNAEMLEWFRFFSYAMRPRKSFQRHDVRVLTSRDPDPVEAVALYSGQQVVELSERNGTDPQRRQWEIAMTGESLTGFLSWLESAPPGPPRA
ncbi:MAG: DUF2550 domain-containing protein [Microlunatus sp.]|nr:DUF2550 domain-containing protein [Microlunatus sp.]MDN5804713.1 DUF2550 domain-containing protein [Microlunatus sp.]